MIRNNYGEYCMSKTKYAMLHYVVSQGVILRDFHVFQDRKEVCFSKHSCAMDFNLQTIKHTYPWGFSLIFVLYI